MSATYRIRTTDKGRELALADSPKLSVLDMAILVVAARPEQPDIDPTTLVREVREVLNRDLLSMQTIMKRVEHLTFNQLLRVVNG